MNESLFVDELDGLTLSHPGELDAIRDADEEARIASLYGDCGQAI